MIEPKVLTALALDLATNTGYVVYKLDSFKPVCSGRINIDTPKVRTHTLGSRSNRLYKFVASMCVEHDVDVLIYENVSFLQNSTAAAHLYGALKCTIERYSLDNNMELIPLSVQHIKKSVTSKGNASKDEVVQAVRALGHKPSSEDEADAIAMMYAVANAIAIYNELDKAEQPIGILARAFCEKYGVATPNLMHKNVEALAEWCKLVSTADVFARSKLRYREVTREQKVRPKKIKKTIKT